MHIRHQKPHGVMVRASYGVRWSKSSCLLTEDGVRANNAVYIELLEENVLFLQDVGTAHTANTTQN